MRARHIQVLGWILFWLAVPVSGGAQTGYVDLECPDFSVYFFQHIPEKVYADQVDELYELVLAADDRCELGEPLGRVQILASIWDGGFQESIYGYEVIGWLVDRYDPQRQPDAGTAEAVFDTFTTVFADQMLPHVVRGSLDEFFCLYYAGNVAAAWALLQTDQLADTWLRYYYDEAVGVLENQKSPYILAARGGQWSPRGELGLVGPKVLVGATIEQRWSRWFGRLVLEGRLGRADAPYLVDRDGVTGSSDRWDAVLLGLEAGRLLVRLGRHQVDGYLGVGVDAVQPFKDEDINLASLNFSAGLGYRVHWGRTRRWFLGVDGRTELMGDRNGGGQNLGGAAWSAVLSMGFALAADPGPRLRALGK